MAANAGEVRAKLVLDNAQFRQGVSQARQEMQGLGQGANQTAQGMSMLNKASAAAGIAVVGAVGASVKAAANFEQSMAKVKAISGATDGEFKQLTDTAKDLGATTQFSASQAADGLAFLSLAGFKAQDSINAMPAVLNLAAAGAIDLGTAADISSNIMTGFGVAAKDTGVAADILTKTFTTANTDMNQLGMAMKYVAPVANALGWEMTDAATAVAKMSDAGIQGSQAGTSLRAMLLSLANPTGQTEKAFEKLGISVVNANGQFKPLPELIAHISSKMEGMTDAQKTVTAAQLVGTEASAGFLALIKQGAPALQEYKTSLEESGGTAERVAKIQQETLLGAWNQVKSAAEGLAITLGEALIPTFTGLAKGAADMMSMLNQVDPAFVKFGITAVSVTAGAIGLAMGIGKIVTGMRLLSVAMMTNPATMWIAGVSAAVGLLTATLMGGKKENEEYKEVSLDVYKQLGDQAKTVGDLTNQFDSMRGKIKLNNDELLHYKDVLGQVDKAENPEKKKKLTDELDRMAKASGVSREELEKFLGVNDELIKQTPGIAQSYDTKGNAIAQNTDAAKALVESLKEQQRIELELQRQQAMKNSVKHMKDYKQAVDDGNDAIGKRKELQANVAEMEERVNQRQKEADEAQGTALEKLTGGKEKMLGYAKEQLEQARQAVIANEQDVLKAKEKLTTLDQQLNKMNQVTQEISMHEMKQINLTAERGKEVEQIDKALSKEQEKRNAMDQIVSKGKELNDEQKKQYEGSQKYTNELERAKGVIQGAQADHERITSEIEKQKQEYGTLNDEIGKPKDKKVDLKTDEAKGKNKELEGEIEKNKDKKVGLDKKKAEQDNKDLEGKIEKNKDKKVGIDKKEADKGVAELDRKAVAEKIKKILGDGKKAEGVIKAIDQYAEAKKTKKVDADKSQADAKIADTDRKALAERIKKILGDGKDADTVIKVLDQQATAQKTKKIDADTSQAESKNETLTQKILKPLKKTISLEWLGNLNPLKYFHSGGTVGSSPSNRSTRPKYHNGGNPRGLVGGGAKFDEVDARLLKNEMVLTQAQQARLFNFIRTANRPTTVNAFSKPQGDQVGNTTMNVNVNVAEMNVRDDQDLPKLAQQISRELAKQQRSLERSRGR
ncbi:tail tape measure protein [Bacillus cereus]|uniref:phage tail tape measure protein n=1 Tax=Bacillus cereus TaxID=1396 RepID=UPI00065B5047|nr:phage tail tape measure protein [Bacillus cereus]KMP38880.1 tail tape measure protein [Bacillus cereus]